MNDIQPILAQIQQLEAERKYPAALELAQQSMRKFQQSRALVVILARLLHTCKDYTQALALYRRLHEETQKAGKKTELPLLVGLARCLFKNFAL